MSAGIKGVLALPLSARSDTDFCLQTRSNLAQAELRLDIVGSQRKPGQIANSGAYLTYQSGLWSFPWSLLTRTCHRVFLADIPCSQPLQSLSITLLTPASLIPK